MCTPTKGKSVNSSSPPKPLTDHSPPCHTIWNPQGNQGCFIFNHFLCSPKFLFVFTRVHRNFFFSTQSGCLVWTRHGPLSVFGRGVVLQALATATPTRYNSSHCASQNARLRTPIHPFTNSPLLRAPGAKDYVTLPPTTPKPKIGLKMHFLPSAQKTFIPLNNPAVSMQRRPKISVQRLMK